MQMVVHLCSAIRHTPRAIPSTCIDDPERALRPLLVCGFDQRDAPGLALFGGTQGLDKNYENNPMHSRNGLSSPMALER